MRDLRIDRLLGASLHQAIADCLPLQLEFYETWLRPFDWRKNDLRVASILAVLSFLRREGDVYGDVMAAAGRYAAEWRYHDLPWLTRRVGRRIAPGPIRRRKLLRVAGQLVATTSREGGVTVRAWRGGPAIEVAGSIFCEVREPSHAALCTYYAAAIEHLYRLDRQTCTVSIRRCRAQGAERCTFAIDAW